MKSAANSSDREMRSFVDSSIPSISSSHPMNKLYKSIIILSIIGLILPSFVVFGQGESLPKQPETFEEAKEQGEKFGREAIAKLPTLLKGIWQNEVLPAWYKIWNWTKRRWYEYIDPRIDPLWNRIRGFLGREIEERAPIIKEEFEKEKEELKEDLPKVSKSLWERFNDLIK